ncbi:hypothetical protein O1611_g3817 [Lasiodiplodia mahajangana]|uniref:Uncharacterized protein n=1 Tax=Lasiodiplodia mahajangana TaxID=1108764 RepID=A0ACC2JQP9_9PEZI|nr:hypothetical protein O1611_g3817 [Lasiodiplodia mahajangana]
MRGELPRPVGSQLMHYLSSKSEETKQTNQGVINYEHIHDIYKDRGAVLGERGIGRCPRLTRLASLSQALAVVLGDEKRAFEGRRDRQDTREDKSGRETVRQDERQKPTDLRLSLTQPTYQGLPDHPNIRNSTRILEKSNKLSRPPSGLMGGAEEGSFDPLAAALVEEFARSRRKHPRPGVPEDMLVVPSHHFLSQSPCILSMASKLSPQQSLYQLRTTA